MGKTVFQGQAVIAAGDTDVDVIANKRFRIVDENSFGELLMTGSAIGLQAQMFVGKANVMEKSDISAANRIPQDPQDKLMDEIEIRAGQQLQLPVSNPTAGDLTVFWKIVLDDNVQYNMG